MRNTLEGKIQRKDDAQPDREKNLREQQEKICGG
jgi:hypothetical protein